MSNYEVLVVDDDSSAVGIYSEYIEKLTLLKTTFATNKDDALSIIRNNNIKVVVLDQRMPNITGTELYKIIKSIAPDIQAIMFSGEAEAHEVGTARDTLKYGRYLHKSESKKLHEVVFEMYAKYDLDIIKTEDKIKLKQNIFKRLFFLILRRKIYILRSHLKANSNYIFSDSWKNIESINEGEEKEMEVEFSCETKFIFETEVSTSSSYCYNDLLNKLKAKLDVKAIGRSESVEKSKISKKIKMKFDTQNLDSTSAMIVSKSYEMAYVYDEYRVVILEHCPLCNTHVLKPINVYRQSPKYATRIIYHYSNGDKKPVDTGIHGV